MKRESVAEVISPTFVQNYSVPIELFPVGQKTQVMTSPVLNEQSVVCIGGNKAVLIENETLYRQLTLAVDDSSDSESSSISHATECLIQKDHRKERALALFTTSCIMHLHFGNGQREMAALSRQPSLVWPAASHGLFLAYNNSDNSGSLTFLASALSQELPIEINQSTGSNSAPVCPQILTCVVTNTSVVLFLGLLSTENSLACFAFDSLAIDQHRVDLQMDLCFKFPIAYRSSMSHIECCLFDSLKATDKRLAVLYGDIARIFAWDGREHFECISNVQAVNIASVRTLWSDKLDLLVRHNEWTVSLYLDSINGAPVADLNIQVISDRSNSVACDHSGAQRLTRGNKKKGRLINMKTFMHPSSGGDCGSVYFHFSHGTQALAKFDFVPTEQLVVECLNCLRFGFDSATVEQFVSNYFHCLTIVPEESSEREWFAFSAALLACLGEFQFDPSAFVTLDSEIQTLLDAVGEALKLPFESTMIVSVTCLSDLLKHSYELTPLCRKEYRKLSYLLFFWYSLSGQLTSARQIFEKFPRTLGSISSLMEYGLDRKAENISMCTIIECSNTLDHKIAESLQSATCDEMYEQILHLTKDLKQFDLYHFSPSSRVIIAEVFNYYRNYPKPSLPSSFLRLIGRSDLAMLKGAGKASNTLNILCSDPITVSKKQKWFQCNSKLTQDNRLDEVERLFDYGRMPRVKSGQFTSPEVSDLNESQQLYLGYLSNHKFALPIGKGMLDVSSVTPQFEDKIQIDGPEVAAKLEGTKLQIKLDRKVLPSGYTDWTLFHSGVSAALSIDTSKTTDLDGSWIVFNRPEVLEPKHAGFILGLGLNGMLRKMKPFHEFEYLNCKHELTSMSLLLGLAAAFVGTESERLTRIVSIHLPALLPPNTTHLNRSSTLQSAAIISLGLLHQASANRRFSQIALMELGRQELLSFDANSVFRESYSLSAGFCLGNINLGCGLSHLGEAFMTQLKKYIHGGSANFGEDSLLLSSRSAETGSRRNNRFKEMDLINIDVTAPGAISALALAYVKSNDNHIASILSLPHQLSEFRLLTPERIMMMTLGKCLIMWNSIDVSEEFIVSNVPAYLDLKSLDMLQSSCEELECISGSCFAMSMKYASSSNPDASQLLLNLIKKIMPLCQKPKNVSTVNLSDRVSYLRATNCLKVVLISLAIIMAGSGDVECLKLFRKMMLKVGPDFGYGYHLTISMSIGLLFLGKGRISLGTSNRAIAAMFMAFCPRYPSDPFDNRPHLQALRNFWYMATESRLLGARDIDEKVDVSIPLTINLHDGTQSVLQTPCILPDLNTIQSISINGEESPQVYFPLLVDFSKADQRKFVDENNFIPLKKRFTSEFFGKNSVNDLSMWFRPYTGDDLHWQLLLIEKFYDRMEESMEFGTERLLTQRDLGRLIMEVKWQYSEVTLSLNNLKVDMNHHDSIANELKRLRLAERKDLQLATMILQLQKDSFLDCRQFLK